MSEETVKLALVGESGSGKTHQAGYLIEGFGADNVGLISCERGLGTIKSLLTPENVFVAETYEDLRKAHVWAKERYDRPDAHVFIDGASRVMQWLSNREHSGADRVLEALVLGREPKEADKPFLRYITKDAKIDTVKIWIRGGRDAEIFWDAWIKAQWNLYATFWTILTPSGQFEKKLPWTVDAPGDGMRNAVISSFDYIFHLERVKGEGFRAHTAPDSGKYRCKRRLDPRLGLDIPDEIEDFNLAEFYRTLKPTITQETNRT